VVELVDGANVVGMHDGENVGNLVDGLDEVGDEDVGLKVG